MLTLFLQTLQGKQNKDYTKVRDKLSQSLTDFDENILVDKKTSLIIHIWKRMDHGNSFSLLLGLSQKWWITINESWHVKKWDIAKNSKRANFVAPATIIKVTTKNTHRYCTPKRPIGVFPIKSFHSEKNSKVFLILYKQPSISLRYRCN